MKVAIIGYGLEGKAAATYWGVSNEVTVCDLNSDIEVPSMYNSQLGTNYLADIDRFDIIVRSPHIRLDQLSNAAGAGTSIVERVTTNTDEFLSVCPTKNVIAVTGTKGKGTTCSLIAALLRATGKSVHLGGNIGVPALHLLEEAIQPDDWVILELSSFQLIDLKTSPHIAVCLMVAPEHLDWHPDTDEYYNAKSQLFRHQRSDDVAIYYAENEYSKRIASTGSGWKIPYYREPGAYVNNEDDQSVFSIGNKTICATDKLRLVGKHNWQNVCAALTAVWQVEQNALVYAQVLESFVGLPHRLSFVRSLNEVDFYDDSFGTTPETAIVAIEAFSQPKVLVLGGSDKGASYDALASNIVSNNVRHVLLIGEQADRIQAALDANGFRAYQSGGNTMAEIVAKAQSVAQPGDVVLLSTACASFDMFQDYIDRGTQFIAGVQALEPTV